MNILVTGAKGFVGRNLCESLKCVRDGKDKTRNVKIDEIYEYDIDTPEEYLDLYTQKADFVARMIYTILYIAAHTNKEKIIVRIHESGDFYNKAYVNKWLEIMDFCMIDKRIKFIAYTKSFPYFDGLELPGNFAFRASIWDDTKPEFLEI